MEALTVIGLLVLLAAGVFFWLKLRPRLVASALERDRETRVVAVTIGAEPVAWRALFIVDFSGLPGRRDEVRAALARETEASDVVLGLATTVTGSALAQPSPGEAAFAGTLDDQRRDRITAAFERTGLQLKRLELVHALPIDARMARLAQVQILGAQRGTWQGPCNALDFYLDGISGLGQWRADHFESGMKRVSSSVDLVGSPRSRFELVLCTGSRVVFYRTLGSLLEGTEEE